MEGIVVKAYGGFYYVVNGYQRWECSLRGRLHHQKQRLVVGDRVIFKPRHGLAGVIEEILPRRTVLTRPLIANVTQAVIVMAVTEPPPNLFLLDRLLIQTVAAGVSPVICWNKADLGPDRAQDLAGTYRQSGYPVLITSAREKTGLDQWRAVLEKGISVLAGPSGVGKSALLNAFLPGLALRTGEVSPKLGRGRHTTRHVELLTLTHGGLVADTPGFSSLALPEMAPEELATYFPEYAPYRDRCRFTGCLHLSEPGCAVKEAVAGGAVAATRYRHYRQFMDEIKKGATLH